jgi:chromosome partitioning protein
VKTIIVSSLKGGSGKSTIAVDTLTPAGVDYLFVDTPPQRPDPVTIQAADLVMIPVKPSPNDLRAVGETLAVVERLQKPFCFVITMAKSRTRIAMDALQALAQYGRVAPVMLGDRIDFAESMIDGLAVGELAPNSKSAEEITQLWSYVTSLLRKD